MRWPLRRDQIHRAPRSNEPEIVRSPYVIRRFRYERYLRTERLPPARILIVENLSPNLPSNAVRKNHDYDENGDIKVHGRVVFNYQDLITYGVALSITPPQKMLAYDHGT